MKNAGAVLLAASHSAAPQGGYYLEMYPVAAPARRDCHRLIFGVPLGPGACRRAANLWREKAIKGLNRNHKYVFLRAQTFEKSVYIG